MCLSVCQSNPTTSTSGTKGNVNEFSFWPKIQNASSMDGRCTRVGCVAADCCRCVQRIAFTRHLDTSITLFLSILQEVLCALFWCYCLLWPLVFYANLSVKESLVYSEVDNIPWISTMFYKLSIKKMFFLPYFWRILVFYSLVLVTRGFRNSTTQLKLTHKIKHRSSSWILTTVLTPPILSLSNFVLRYPMYNRVFLHSVWIISIHVKYSKLYAL